MRQIPIRIKTAFEALLARKKVPKTSHFSYLKWLRYYLDFCLKYDYEKSNKESLFLFVKKLKEKSQNEEQRKQAFYAVSIFYELKEVDQDKIGALKNKKKNISIKKIDLKETRSDWKPVYNDFHLVCPDFRTILFL